MNRLDKQKVLVVDDEKVVRDLVQRILTKAGYEVLVSGDCPSVLETLHSEHVDMVVSDVKMPAMDGLTLLKQIKSEFPQVAFVVMTAHSDTYTLKDALVLGADEYVIKPFKPQEVVAVVERAFWRLESARQQPESPR